MERNKENNGSREIDRYINRERERERDRDRENIRKGKLGRELGNN